MIWVALGAIALAAISISLLVGLLAKLIRQHARERDLLLNQLLNLAGRPWQTPPAVELYPQAEQSEAEPFADLEQLA